MSNVAGAASAHQGERDDRRSLTADRALVVVTAHTPEGDVDELTERLREHVTAVERVPRQLVRDHPWCRRKRGLVFAATGDPLPAALAAADADLPLVLLAGADEPAPDRTDTIELVSHTVLVVHLDDRPPRLALGECVATPIDPLTMLKLDIDRDTFVARAPAVRVATADPLHLLGEARCQHTGAPSTVGVCWSLDQPDADRMIRRRSQVEVSSLDHDKLTVTCDGGRFSGLANHVRVGPNRRFRLALLAPRAA